MKMKKKIVALMLTGAMLMTPVVGNAGNGNQNVATRSFFTSMMGWKDQVNNWLNSFVWRDEAKKEADTELQKVDTPTLELTRNSISAASRVMTIKWTKVEGATKYEVQRATNSDFENAVTREAGKGSGTLTFRISSGSGVSLPARYTYYFRVRAITNDGFGEWSNTVVAEGNL